jgi:long-chain acyl-CoA synthetase
MTPSTANIPAWLLDHTQSRAAEPALWTFQNGAFQSTTWGELGATVARAAKMLEALGIEPGDRVASCSENRSEWIVLDLALLVLGAVHVPIHATLAGKQVYEQIENSGAKLLAVSSIDFTKFLPALPEGCLKMLCIGPSRFLNRKDAYAWDEQMNAVVGEPSLADFATRIAQIEPQTLATIMYTSGTTGHPRGVMLSQGNLASNAQATADAYPNNPSEVRLGFLPLSHIYARTCDLYAWVYRGSQYALVRNRETILDDCALVHPTTINGVPYFYDKLSRRLHESGKSSQPGIVQHLLGGQVKHCFCGGAALPAHVEAYFESQGVPILAGYGLSETSPVISVSTKEHHRAGAVGRVLPGVEVRFAEDGELLTRGAHVMLGYWQDEAATEAVLKDGWLRTGDLGRLDDEGYLYITGRKKEILVTALGKKVEPTAIERQLVASPLILQALVVGEGRNYLTAILVPNPERLRAEIRSRRLWVFSRRGALRHKQVLAMYRAEIDRLLTDLSRHEQIGRFVLLDRGFTIESGELTPKGSLRREAIVNQLAAEIEQMYARS